MERARTTSKQNQGIRGQVAMLNIFQQNIYSIARSRDQEQTALGSMADFNGHPFLLLSLSHWASYSTNLDRTLMLIDSSPAEVQQRWVKAREVVLKNIKDDPIRFRINGTSLFDVSCMPLPLSTIDIKKIDSMIKIPAKSKTQQPGQPTDHASFIQNVILFAATQAELHRKAPISDNVKPTVKRLENYWEYYTAWVLDSDQSKTSTLLMYAMIRGGCLVSGLLPFISARLQITPSSTYRLIDAHIENYNPVTRFLWRHGRYTKYLSDYLHNVNPVKGLPKAIEPYQFTDPDSERKLVRTLKEAYRDKAAPTEEPESLARKISDLYHKSLREAVQGSSDGFLKIPAQDDSFFREILAGVVYGKTLTIIGLTEDPQVFATIDLLQNGQLFGIPAQLKNDPHNIKNNLVHDLLTPVLNEARRRNPLTEFKPTNQSISYTTSNHQSTTTEEPSKPVKRKVLKTIADIASGHRPTLSLEILPEVEKDKRVLVYKGQIVNPEDLSVISEKIAEDLIANNTKLKDDIILIIQSLLEDPYGPGTYKIKDAKPIKEKGQSMPLKGFRGDVRRLPFGNKEFSDRLRSVYYINPKDKSVNLVQVLTHDNFTKLYGGK